MSGPTLQERRQGIAARFAELVARHSQSEIARKTGASRMSINRYLNGARLPSEFTGALADSLGVNPAWLINGDGPPQLSDAAPDTVRAAGNLLDLIKSMSAVEQMQLGALTGKHHLRVLRELSDATTRYERLREQLNKRSMPALRRVLDDLQDALDKRDVDRAEELSRTAEQLGRFCDDPALALEGAVIQSRLAALSGESRRSLDMTRRVATLALHHPHLLRERQLEALAETSDALNNLGRQVEARRIAEGALALAPKTLRDSAPAHRLAVAIALGQIQGGELHAGMHRITSLYHKLQGESKELADAVMARAMLLAGMTDIQATIAMGDGSRLKAALVIGMAVILEREQELEQAIAYRDKVVPLPSECKRKGCIKKTLAANLSGVGCERLWACATLSALRGETKETAALAHALEQQKPDPAGMALNGQPILAAQFFRLMGRKTDAKRCFRASCRAFQNLPPDFAAPVQWQARHMRNALELGTKAQQREARKFFRKHVELGYRCFAHLVT